MNDTNDTYEANPTTWRAYDTLRKLEVEAGVQPGEPFQTTRVAVIVESDLRPLTADCALYRLKRDGLIEHHGVPGKGTTIRILRRLG